MFTDKRLTNAYKSAKIEYFDKSSRYIIFSDAHRGDDSVSDEFSRNQNIFSHALDYYYAHGYVYVEAGDGDELWEHARFKHIRLAHSDVFLTLKRFYDKNRLIFLYGNHNIFLRSKMYVRHNFYDFYDEYKQGNYDLFRGIIPYQALVLKDKTSGQEILIVHGHQGDLMNDQLWIVSMLMLRYFWRFMHLVGFQNPASPAKNLYKRHRIEKNYKKWIRRHKMMLICGHTHRPKFPKKNELPYFNSGCCIHTKGLTGIEISEGNIMMVDWRIRADEVGVLRIERHVMRGPESIKRYNNKQYFNPANN